jgi:hypothetical protein
MTTVHDDARADGGSAEEAVATLVERFERLERKLDGLHQRADRTAAGAPARGALPGTVPVSPANPAPPELPPSSDTDFTKSTAPPTVPPAPSMADQVRMLTYEVLNHELGRTGTHALITVLDVRATSWSTPRVLLKIWAADVPPHGTAYVDGEQVDDALITGHFAWVLLPEGKTGACRVELADSFRLRRRAHVTIPATTPS